METSRILFGIIALTDRLIWISTVVSTDTLFFIKCQEEKNILRILSNANILVIKDLKPNWSRFSTN